MALVKQATSSQLAALRQHNKSGVLRAHHSQEGDDDGPRIDVEREEAALASRFLAQSTNPSPLPPPQPRKTSLVVEEDELEAKAKRSMAQIKETARLQKWARESGEVFTFGSNGLMQLGRPGAERKLHPYAMAFAKSKRIIYLHAELTSTFAMAADKKMYFWGTSPLNPNQLISPYDFPERKNEGRLSRKEQRQLEKQRKAELARREQQEKDMRMAGSLVSMVPEFERMAKDHNLSREVASMLPHEFHPPWDTKQEPVVWLACGVEHVCGVTGKGRVFTYGSGANGRLGHGSTNNLVLPEFLRFSESSHTPVDDVILSAYCGADFTLLLSQKGKVFSFGSGVDYQLGNGYDNDRQHVSPVEALRHSKVVVVAVGSHHCLALLATGFVMSWGLNNMGQCGLGHTEVVKTPTAIEYARETARTKEWNMAMLREKQEAKRRKRIEKAMKQAQQKKGQDDADNPFLHQHLNEDSSDEVSSDCSSDNLDKWREKRDKRDAKLRRRGIKKSSKQEKDEEAEEKKVEARWDKRQALEERLEALKEDEEEMKDPKKRLKLKRKREKLERKMFITREKRREARLKLRKALMDEKHQRRNLPDSHDAIRKGFAARKDMKKVPTNFVNVHCGSLFSAAVTESGHVYTWGDNSDGQLGVGNVLVQKVPTLVTALSGHVIVQVACGRKHAAALSAHGQVFTWGGNLEGQLGHGHRQACWVPTEVMAFRGRSISLISCGLDHTVCLEGAIKKQATEKRKFLTREEMEKELRAQKKAEHEARVRHVTRGAHSTRKHRSDQELEDAVAKKQEKAEVEPDDMMHRGVVMTEKKKKIGKSKKAAVGGGMVAVAALTMAAAALGSA